MFCFDWKSCVLRRQCSLQALRYARIYSCPLLGACAKLGKVAVWVCPSAWNNSASTGQVLMKFDIWVFLENNKHSSSIKILQKSQVELKRNLMAHGEAREEKWRGKRRMKWVGSTHALYGNTVYPALLPLMRTPLLPAADWTDTPADINGLVRFAGRPNLVSARVPSHSVSTLPHIKTGVQLYLHAVLERETGRCSIPDGVIGIFHWHKILPIALWPWDRLSL